MGDELAGRVVGQHHVKVVVAGFGRMELAFGAIHFVEEFGHVAGQVFDDFQIAQRRNFQGAVAGDFVDVGAARPARLTVDGHRARSAHADPAREPIAQRRINVALDVGDHIKDGLRRLARHFKGFELALFAAAPHRYMNAVAHMGVYTLC